MTSRDELRALAEKGMSASSAAQELGISRQRVYDLARQMGVKFNRARHIGFSRRLAPDKRHGGTPRIITGGILISRVSPSAAGKISELLVAADLMARGWQVFLPVYPNRGHDMIAVRGDTIITVEVRSGHKTKTGAISCFKRPEDHSDYYGIVAKGEPVHYDPALD